MQGHPIRVLLIDDDEGDYIVVRDLLSDISSIEFILKWVSDYRAALDAILSNEFDVCLLDYRLNEHDGLELMQEAVSRGAMTPIVFFTGHGTYDLNLEVMSKGAADWLTKGELSATLLERSIRQTMERQRKREELIKAKRVIQALSECNHAVIHIKDELELLREICHIVVGVGGYRMAWVGWAEEDRDQTVTPVARYGHEEEYLDTVKVTWKDAERGKGPTGTCIRTGVPCIIRSVDNQAEFAPWKAEASKRGYASVIGLPLLLDGRRLGALTIYSSETDAFDTEEVEFLVKLSGNLSYGIGVLGLRKAQMQAEESLKEANIGLEKRVEERTAELVKVNAELRKEVEERRQAQDELFNSRQMLRSVLDNIPQRVFWKDRNSVYVGCNKPFALDWGYEDPGELVGKTSYETASAAIADRYSAVDREVMEGGRPKINCEELQIRPDGSQAWLVTSKLPMHGKDGQVIGMLGTYADITERKLMEEKIRQTNAYLENIFENSPDAITIVDNHGRFIRWNKMAEALHGYTFEEMKGKSAFDLYVDKDNLEKMLAGLRREGSVKKWETRMKMGDGRIVPFEISVGLLKDSQNQTLGSVGVARDLSGIKEAFSALKASHERLYQEIAERKKAEEIQKRLVALLEQTPDFVAFADAVNTNILYINRAGRKMVGIGEDEDVTRIKITDLYSKETNRMIVDEIMPCTIRDGVWKGEYPILSRDGREIPASRVILAHKGPDGKTEVFSTIARDITEQKELIRQLEEKALKLQNANEEIKRGMVQLVQAEKMSALGQLTAGVAHELNQPLNVIKIICQSLLKDMERNQLNTGDLQPDLGDVVGQVDKMAQIIDHMRVYTRRTEGKTAEATDVNTPMEGAFRFLGQQLRNHGIEVLTEFESHLPQILVDPIRIEQVIVNLITNARDALETSGKEYKCIKARTYRVNGIVGNEAESGSNSRSSATAGPFVVMEVSDSGLGIPEHIREKIFDPFFTMKEPGKGTGLGLHVGRKIIEEHGGKIEVDSTLGEGTTFRVVLPAIDEKE